MNGKSADSQKWRCTWKRDLGTGPLSYAVLPSHQLPSLPHPRGHLHSVLSCLFCCVCLLSRYAVASLCGFTCISTTTSKDEHQPFKCSCSACSSSLLSVQIICPLFYWVIHFLLIVFWETFVFSLHESFLRWALFILSQFVTLHMLNACLPMVNFSYD